MPGLLQVLNKKSFGVKGKRMIYLVLGAAILLGGWAGYNSWSGPGDSSGVVVGSGTIEGTGILVSSQLFGQIAEMAVREGQRLEQGDRIARLDSAELADRVQQARAQMEIAARQVEQAGAALDNSHIKSSQASLAVKLADQQSVGQVAQARAAVQAAEANLRMAQAARDKSQEDYARYTGLYQDGAVPAAQFREVENAYQLADAGYTASAKELERTQASLRLAETSELSTGIQQKEAENAVIGLTQAEINLRIAQAQEEAARAALDEAEAVLAKTAISAPVRGTVVKKLVEQGELVNPGTPLVKLVDMDKLELTVYIPGQYLGQVRIDQNARVYSDSFSDKTFPGHVSAIAQEAEFTPKNVQVKEERVKMVYAVKIKLEDTQGLLKPGMPADAEILSEDDAPPATGA